MAWRASILKELSFGIYEGGSGTMKEDLVQHVAGFLQELIQFAETLPSAQRDNLLVVIDRFMSFDDPESPHPAQVHMDI